LGQIYPNTEVTIFNRWGQEVYRSLNYDNSFDGKGLPDGVYFFLMDVKEAGNPVVRGSLTILR
jgi:hypothetical protein